MSLQNEFEAAEPLFRRVLKAREGSLKESDPDLALSCFRLADVLNELDQKKEALVYAKRAAKLAAGFLPEDDKDRQRYEKLVDTLQDSKGNFPGESKAREATE